MRHTMKRVGKSQSNQNGSPVKSAKMFDPGGIKNYNHCDNPEETIE